MPFTRNINYTQNIPVSLGFSSSHFNPTPARTVTAIINLGTLGNAFSIDFDSDVVAANPTVIIDRGYLGLNSAWDGRVTLTGPVDGVNALLATATACSRFYDIEDTIQDVNSQNRSVGNSHGELCVQLPEGTDTTYLTVGSVVLFNTVDISPSSATNTATRFLITRVDTTNCPVRVWCIYQREYNTSDLYYSGNYKNVFTTATTSNPCWIQRASGVSRVNIAPVIDVSYMNASGYYTFTFQEIDGATNDISTFNLIGSHLVAEPIFTTQPASSLVGSNAVGWFATNVGGVISQAENNFQTLQYLLKACHNDPLYLDVSAYTSLPGYPAAGTDDDKDQFVGNLINTKAGLGIPRYITDTTYGIFGDVQVGERASISYTTTTPVRWSFYGTPEQCNKAMEKSSYFRAPTGLKDVKLEVRVVNDRTRIYSGRGN